MTVLVDARRRRRAGSRLNRPDQRNAIVAGNAGRPGDAFSGELDADAGVRVVVLTGAGTAFCAGVDLQGGLDGERLRPPRSSAQPVDRATRRFGKPVDRGDQRPGGRRRASSSRSRATSAIASTRRDVRAHRRCGSAASPAAAARSASRVRCRPRSRRQMIFTGELVDADTALRAGLVCR